MRGGLDKFSSLCSIAFMYSRLVNETFLNATSQLRLILKFIPPFLKRRGLYFSTAQGNSIGKTLYEDIQTWNEFLQGLDPPEIKRQRLEELTGEKNFSINLSWDVAFKNVALAKREYMKAMLTNEEDLSKPPRIKV